MMRSCASATSAPAAIFTSNRTEMYMVTRITNTIRPMIIFREIVLPQVGPTSSSLIWLGETPAALAKAARSWSPLSVGITVLGVGTGVALGVAVGVTVGVGAAVGEGLEVAVGVGATGPAVT